MKKITPFCCDMTGKTEAEIRSLHKMCIDAGGEEYESSDTWVYSLGDYNYMGIDYEDDVISLGYPSDSFCKNLLTLEDVPAHLGLLKECETAPLSDSPSKWTKAMQKEGIPLSVGMLALLEHSEEKEVLVLGLGNRLVLVEVEGSEGSLPKEFVIPFPEEETVEQKEQRKYFINEAKATMTTSDAEELYEDVKHLFKD